MSLHLNHNPTFKTKVGIPVPELGEVEITVDFKYLDKDALKVFLERTEQVKDDFVILSEIVLGWSGVDTPFSKEALGVLIKNYHASARVLMHHFLKELSQQRLDF